MVDKYNDSLQDLLDTHAPLTMKRVLDRPAAPWIGEEEREARKHRRKAEKLWRETRLHVHKDISKEKRPLKMKFTNVRRFPVLANLISFLIALVVAAVFLLHPMHAVQRGFFCDDLSIRYPYRPNTISIPLLVVTSFVPAVLLVMGLEMTYGLLTMRRCYSAARESTIAVNGAANGSASVSIAIGSNNNGDRTIPRWDGLRAGIGRGGLLAAYLLYGNSLCFSLTEVFKLSFGTLRPSFLSACQPLTFVTSLANCSAGEFVQEVQCQSPESSRMIDMRKSFISGHASFAVYNMFFIVLYLQRRLPLSTPRMLMSLLQTVAVGYAVLVCASRIYDHFHHPPDVLGGAVLGILTCWVTMFKICPSDIRHPPRTHPDLLSSQGTKHGTSPQCTKRTNSMQLTAVHTK